MSISQQQLEISNKSYTNKDFPTIYNELLGYAEKLSYRFSPTNSNESDPFIVMLKLAAFVGDKVNYNVDKNLLERFMLSCTQESSMQELTSMLGYRMHFYKAATTEVVFRCPSWEDNSELIIPKHSVLAASGDIQYITLAETQIDNLSKQSGAIPAIQGKLKTLSVLGNSLIQLENLDENNRIYFPEYMVAENGVYITSNILSEDWDLVDTLNEQIYLSGVFTFGYDSKKKLPYVEFPHWINQIIGDGLTIKYVITDGYAGNVGPKSFTSVARATSKNYADFDDSKIFVINNSAASNGKDPETINEAYSGFKRLVGTLDTLVTCRDYAAKIYELVDKYNDNIVSNVIVTDRRSDINNSYQLYSVEDTGPTFKNKSYKSGDDDKISAYNLCVYAFRPIRSLSYSSIDKSGGYYDSYNLVVSSVSDQIANQLEDSKSISHNFKALEQGDIVAIRMYVKLNLIVSTNVKVSSSEASDIIKNIYNALIRDYNPRTLNFGEEISFDALYGTIMAADARIKNISLQEPEQTPKITTHGESSLALNESDIIIESSDGKAELSSAFAFILTKNIISGRISLFNFDDSFEYLYDQKGTSRYKDITHIKTEASINLQADTYKKSYSKILDENEVIQFLAPKLTTEVTYPYGVVYNLHLENDKTHIPKNTEYLFSENEYVIFAYADSSGEWQQVRYPENPGDLTHVALKNQRILCPNFDMYTTAYRKADGETPDKDLPNNKFLDLSGLGNKIEFYQLGAKEEVQCKKPTFEAITSNIYCYWVTQDSKIKWERDGDDKVSYLLKEGEYFYYTDYSSTFLFEYGSGTKLVRTNISAPDEWEHDLDIDLADLTANGLSGIANQFILKMFSGDTSLDIYVNEIKTLATGDMLEARYTTAQSFDAIEIPNNVFADISESFGVYTENLFDIYYTYDANQADAETAMLPNRSSLSDFDWKIRGLLDINCGKTKQQKLLEGQSITLYYFAEEKDADGKVELVEKDILISGDQNVYFKSSVDVSVSGGEKVKLEYFDLSDLDTPLHPDFITYQIDEDTRNFLNNYSDDFYNLDLLYDYIQPGNSTAGNIEVDNDAGIIYHLPKLVKADDSICGATIVLPEYFPENIASVTVKTSKEVMFKAGSKIIDTYPSYMLELTDTLVLNPGINSIFFIYNSEDTGLDELYFKLYLEKKSDATADVLRLTARIDKIHIIEGINEALGVDALIKSQIDLDSVTAVLADLPNTTSLFIMMRDYIFKYEGDNAVYPDYAKCYLLGSIDKVKQVEATKHFPLTSAQSFYDPNNVANRWVIPRIDFSNSIIKIAASSLK